MTAEALSRAPLIFECTMSLMVTQILRCTTLKVVVVRHADFCSPTKRNAENSVPATPVINYTVALPEQYIISIYTNTDQVE